jgi:hypothetical protein
VQYLRPGFKRSTLNAWGTTTRFFLLYSGGTPSKVLRRSRAAAPRGVLCGIMPRTVRQNILDGARKWKGPGCVNSALRPVQRTVREYLTTTGGVVTGLLAEESLVLDCGTSAMLVQRTIDGAARSVRLRDMAPLLIHRPCLVLLVVSLGPLARCWMWIDVRFARKNSPEMLRASQRTTTIF